ALTQEQADSILERIEQAVPQMIEWDSLPMRSGRASWRGGVGRLGHAVCEDLCELLDLSVGEVWDQLADGKSLAQIADDQGVSEDALVETVVSGASEMLQSRVDDGALTQEQADVMLDRMEQVLRLVIHWEGIPASGGPGFWRGGGFHKGMGPGAMQGLAGTTRPSTDSEGWRSGHSLVRVALQ
ncbi:MAG: hypothetical protein KAX25_03410, partial [Dehalococcoidia bacterium]|nr:hypothetical protein [Dehalococcoidia bacterium]